MTQRSYSEIISLFPDNTSGDISPQDLRDFVDSVRTPHGSFSMQSNAVETVINSIDVYEKVAGTTAAGPHLHDMTMDQSGRLTYTGVSPRHFHLVASIAMTSAANNQTVAFRCAVNGATIDRTMIERRIGTGTDIGAVSLHGDALLNNGDYFEVFVTNETSTANVTINDLYVFAMGMF